MGNFKKFKVVPDLPEKLKPLLDIAANLWLTWNPEAIKLFITMDGDLWEKNQHNPMRMLGEISQEKLDELAHDEGFLSEVQRVGEQLDQYLHVLRSINHTQQVSIAYFSAEYGLSDTLPIYSGGLGILSGDHVKAASDLNLNFHGVGLLYQLGYFQQYLNMDGWQQDFYQVNDFHNMQVQEVKQPDGQPLEIELDFPGRKVYLKVWQIKVGRVSIHMLDSNIEKNSEYDRRLTAQLYGGNPEMRLQQEIILGIGGVKMLDALGIQVTVVHMNEGHSAFTPFERARMLMKNNGLGFAEAMEVVRQSSVFTTHTNVQAAHDVFSPEMLKNYFGNYLREFNISLHDFMACGRVHPDNHQENFSMTVAAVKNSAFVNGVSTLHSEVSRDMLKNLWPAVPPEHVPIQPITNGIHIPSWISFEMNDLFERYLGSKWREKQDYRDAWEKVQNIPDPELWNVHEIRRRRLIAFTRQRLQKQLIAKGASNLLISESQEALNPVALTIGFARRFATYKRAYLIFKDPERLLKILNNPRAAGAADLRRQGPPPGPGRQGADQEHHLLHVEPSTCAGKIAFIEDYDINVARYLVSGVDIWLNTPLRPLEACGTSGMKAACNGVLNFSVLDGWWDEAYDLKNGWAIGNREVVHRQGIPGRGREQGHLFHPGEGHHPPVLRARLRRPAARMDPHDEAFAGHHRLALQHQPHGQGILQQILQERLGKLRQAERRQFCRRPANWSNGRTACTAISRACASRASRPTPAAPTRAARASRCRPTSSWARCRPRRSGSTCITAPSSAMTCCRIRPWPAWATVEKIADGRFRFSGVIPCARTGNFGFKLRVTPFHPLLADPYEMGLVLWS